MLFIFTFFVYVRVVICIFCYSDVCQTQCLTAPGNPTDRWAVAACIGCCLLDLDSDGFIKEQEIRDRFHMCGEKRQ